MRKRTQPTRGELAPARRSNVPTTPPHPIPGGEYDHDGFLYKCPVENLRHDLIRTELASVLHPWLAKRHGNRALVAGDVGLYARRADRFAPPLAPDILVSLTAGAVDAPRTPPAEDRMSYKLWQEPVPDLVIEIVSRGSGERDTRVKPNRYEAIGIPEYWIFDPERHRIAGGLAGRLLAGGTYAHARPSPPRAGEVPVPPGTTAFWSDALGLYLYADGKDLRLHDRRTGRLKNFREEIASREAAEDARRVAEDGRNIAEEARHAAEARATREAARADALEAELRALRASNPSGAPPQQVATAADGHKT